METKKNKWLVWTENAILPLILALYPLRHVWMGIDLRDTGYNYANFRYMGLAHMDSMWVFSTYLANVVGHFFSLLPGGDTLLFMNIYTALVVSATALIAYFFLVKKCGLPFWTVFAGEFAAVSLCWCPTAVLYNYLTYLFLLLCILFLYVGLTEEKKGFLIAAGLVLGANVFVRFSNLPQAVLIVGVLAYGIICRKKIGKVVQETLYCLAGYVGSFLLFLGYISLRYGATAYPEAIKRLFSMTDTASDYKASAMVLGAFDWYIENLYWVIRIGVFLTAACLLWVILPAKWKRLKQAGSVALAVLCLMFLYRRQFASLRFTEYVAMLRPSILFLMLTMLVCLIDVFCPKTQKKWKLLGGFVLLNIFITPIGSNNKLYPAINDLFLAAPYVFTRLYLSGRQKWEKEVTVGKGRISLSAFPLKVFAGLITGIFLFQGVGFGTAFVFAESHGIENADTKMTGCRALTGITMEHDKAVFMQELSDFVTEEGLSGREVILYGDIPAVSFYLGMPSAFNPWSDLASYGIEVMRKDMEKTQAKEILPVVILEKRYALYLKEGEEGLQNAGYAESDISYVARNEKFKLIEDFLENNGYNLIFENEKFGVYDTFSIQSGSNLVQ